MEHVKIPKVNQLSEDKKNVIIYACESVLGSQLNNEEQVAKMREYCAQEGHNIVMEVTDNEENYLREPRPWHEIDEVLLFCQRHANGKAKVDEIIFIEWDKLYHVFYNSIDEFNKLSKINVEIDSLEESMDGESASLCRLVCLFVKAALHERGAIQAI